jgi:hypothetical protein
MTLSDLLRLQFKEAHGRLEEVLAGLSSEQAHWLPPGKPSPIAAQYIHVLISEDGVMSHLAGRRALAEGDYAGRLGCSEVPPYFDWEDWGRRVRVEMAAAQAYAHAVYAQTDAYLATLGPEAVAEVLDLNAIGMGESGRGTALTWMLENIYVHTGEIACLKGLQGLTGYGL